MKDGNKTKYDYSRFTGDGWNDNLYEMEFWGIHKINGRLEIDIERYKAACKQTYYDNYIPKEFSNGSLTGCYIPNKKKKNWPLS